LESLETSFHQDLNGDGVIGVPTASSPASQIGMSGTVTHSAPVTEASNDTFVFKPGFGLDVILNAANAHIELDGFSSITNTNQLQTLLNDAQSGQSQSLFLAANGGHDTVITLGNHDSITLKDAHITDLHASNFIIH
jgi:hypothetical protein